MSTTWIVVADRARARILKPSDGKQKPLSEVIDFVGRAGYVGPEKQTTEKMEELEGLVHPEGQMKAGELRSDRNGKFGDTRVSRQSGDDRTDLQHQTAEEFAIEIVNYLDKARQQKKFDRLGLIAAPMFLGVLRSKLTSPLVKLVALEINKDYTKLKTEDIRKHLPDDLS